MALAVDRPKAQDNRPTDQSVHSQPNTWPASAVEEHLELLPTSELIVLWAIFAKRFRPNISRNIESRIENLNAIIQSLYWSVWIYTNVLLVMYEKLIVLNRTIYC